MEQFNKARGGSGLENVILYGFIEDYIKIVDALDGLDIKASVLGVPSQITGFENFEFTVFANAIGALYKRNKQTERINLLEVDQSTGKGGNSGVSSMLMTAGILAAASAVVIGAITGFLRLRVSSINDDIAAVNADIDKCQVVIDENKVRHNRLEIIEQYKTYVENCQANLDTLPTIDKTKCDKIDEIIKNNSADYQSMTFDATDGAITLSKIEVKDQDAVKTLVDELGNIDFVGATVFSGYSGTGESDDPVIISSLQLILLEEGE